MRQDDVCLPEELDSFSRAVPSGNVTVMKLRQTDHDQIIRIARDGDTEKAAGTKVAENAFEGQGE